MAERGFRQIWRSNSGLRVGSINGAPFIKVESWNLQVEVIGSGADVTGNKGWVALEPVGEEEDIEQGIAWVISKGVRVDPVVGDIVEG